MKVKLYVEGGGDSKEQHARCREGFCKLINNAGFVGRSPAIVACGGRDGAYKKFKTAATFNVDEYPILLVDSEDPVANPDENTDSDSAWQHLKARDGWDCPDSVANDQAQLMATCMEAWIMADHRSLSAFFGKCLQTSALLPPLNIEARIRHEVQDALQHATRNCGKDRSYTKGKKSFEVLGKLDPNTLKLHLPYFRRMIATLDCHL
ncbi:MAG: DUF4276 family protein [Blastocatellia bacterium]